MDRRTLLRYGLGTAAAALPVLTASPAKAESATTPDCFIAAILYDRNGDTYSVRITVEGGQAMIGSINDELRPMHTGICNLFRSVIAEHESYVV
jgi:hypothetical protein